MHLPISDACDAHAFVQQPTDYQTVGQLLRDEFLFLITKLSALIHTASSPAASTPSTAAAVAVAAAAAAAAGGGGSGGGSAGASAGRKDDVGSGSMRLSQDHGEWSYHASPTTALRVVRKLIPLLGHSSGEGELGYGVDPFVPKIMAALKAGLQEGQHQHAPHSACFHRTQPHSAQTEAALEAWYVFTTHMSVAALDGCFMPTIICIAPFAALEAAYYDANGAVSNVGGQDSGRAGVDDQHKGRYALQTLQYLLVDRRDELQHIFAELPLSALLQYSAVDACVDGMSPYALPQRPPPLAIGQSYYARTCSRSAPVAKASGPPPLMQRLVDALEEGIVHDHNKRSSEKWKVGGGRRELPLLGQLERLGRTLEHEVRWYAL
jgi:hypothetical protein